MILLISFQNLAGSHDAKAVPESRTLSPALGFFVALLCKNCYYYYMSYTFTSTFTKQKKGYTATCVELGVVSQGLTVEDAQKNLTEAVELFLEDNADAEKLVRAQKKSGLFVGTFSVHARP